LEGVRGGRQGIGGCLSSFFGGFKACRAVGFPRFGGVGTERGASLPLAAVARGRKS